MSQFTKSADFPQPMDSGMARVAGFFLLVASGLVIAIAALTALEPNRVDEPTAGRPAAVEPGSRLDDYGVRHSVRQPASWTETWSDDYGLRHPVQQTSSESRLDDYGLRQGVIQSASSGDSRLDDYGVRHPTR